MILPNCPHCGDDQEGFLVKGFAQGRIERHFDVAGNNTEDNWNSVRSITYGVVRCMACLHIRRDVQMTDDRRIVPK